MEKEVQVKNTVDNYKEIYRLEKEKDLLNQLVGELRTSKKETENKLADKSRDNKVTVITETKTIKNHPILGNIVADYKTRTSYKNLDDVVDKIRKEESKKLKLDNETLEVQLDDAKIKVSKTERELQKEKDSTREQITEAKDKLRTLHIKDRDSWDEEIENMEKEYADLNDELSKVKANKTDKEFEAKRKQEIIDLKEQITKLNTEIEDLSSINFAKRLWRKFTNYYATKDAIKEVTKTKNRIEEISNKYPKVISPYSPGQLSRSDFFGLPSPNNPW